MKRSILQVILLAGLFGALRVVAQSDTNALATPNDYSSFQIIATKNIFNPNRRPRTVSTYVSTPVARIDAFTLTGTMSSEKGQYAFFDGNSSQYRKTLNIGQSIAGYKVAAIGADAIQLAATSNKTFNLPVGTQMRRREGGLWTFAGQAEPLPDSSASPSSSTTTTTNSASATPSTSSAPSSGSMSDAMKRLMQRRMEEK